MVGDVVHPPSAPPGTGTAVGCGSPSPFDPHWSLYPRTYVAPYAPEPLAIDGDIDKAAWKSVPWSLPFDEIRGPYDAPPSTRPTPSQRTRMKMAWDEHFLYVCALIESDFEVVAEFTERNSPIFQKDSDFEVFLDPTGSCARYKELELNAIDTVWNLMIDVPYQDGGGEYSARIAKPGEERYYEVTAQKTAARVVRGKLNDPTGGGATWAVELALAHSDTLSSGTRGSVPKKGDLWRINFSRVERRGDVNWTWQPQRIWDAELKRVAGKVNMHLPDAWGYVAFGGPEASGEGGSGVQGEISVKGECELRDPTWPERLAAANVYYAQRRFAELNGGSYAAYVFQLSGLVDPNILGPFINSGGNTGVEVQLSDDKKHYTATVVGPGGVKVTITDKRLTTIIAKGGGRDGPKTSR